MNISSIGAHVMFPNYAVYGATKAAVTYLSTSPRTEFGPRDVRVTNIEPGLTDTELAGHVDNAELGGQLDGMFEALGGLSGDEIADLIACATSRARHINLRQLNRAADPPGVGPVGPGGACFRGPGPGSVARHSSQSESVRAGRRENRGRAACTALTATIPSQATIRPAVWAVEAPIADSGTARTSEMIPKP